MSAMAIQQKNHIAMAKRSPGVPKCSQVASKSEDGEEGAEAAGGEARASGSDFTAGGGRVAVGMVGSVV
jgi:hypothetical protein